MGRSRFPSRPGYHDAADAGAPGEERHGASAADDPGRVMQQAFTGELAGGEPDVLVLAWFSMLPDEVEPPRAAHRLGQALRASTQAPLSERQSQLLALLDYVAAHRRVRRP